MKQNLLVTSYDYDISKRLAKKLAEVFSMRMLDEIELFEFDHLPFSFLDVVHKNGILYAQKEMVSIMKNEIDFDDVVFASNIGFAETCVDIFYKIKLSNFVVLLEKNLAREIQELEAKSFGSELEKKYFFGGEKVLCQRKKVIKSEVADIVVQIEDKTDEEIIDEIVDKIKNYYSVN